MSKTLKHNIKKSQIQIITKLLKQVLVIFILVIKIFAVGV